MEPYSEDLDACLMRLETAGVLQALNPSFEKYTINCDGSKISKIERKLQDRGYYLHNENIQALSNNFTLMLQ